MKGIERKISANIIPLLVFLLLPAILLPFASTCPAATFGWMPGRVGDFHGPNWYEDGVDPPVENVLIPLRSAVGYIEKGGTVLFKGGSFDDGYITLYRGATFNMTGGSLGSSADNGVMLRMGDKLRRGGDFLLRGGTCNFENLDIYGSTFRQTGGTIKVSHGELLLGQQGKLEITGGMFRCNQMVNWGDFRAGDSAKVLIERWIGSNAGHAVFSGNARVALGMANIRSLAITDSSVKVKANSLAVGDWEVRTNYQAPRGTTILISASASGQGALIVNRVKGGGIENTHFITSSPMEMGKSVSVYTSYSQDRGCTSVGFLDNGAIGTITVKKGLTQACSPVLYVRELHIGRNARLSYYGKLYYGKLVVEPGGELVPAGPGAKSCRADPPVTRYLAVTIDPPEAGSVRGAGGKIHCPRNCSGQFPDGFTTYLTAETKSGYVFDHWEGPLTTRTNPLPVALDFGDESYRAVYKSLFPPDDTGHGRLGDPVNTATGEHYFNLPVFDLGGPLPLSFHLTYGSSLHDRPNISETFGGTLGHNWMHNFQATRIVDSKTHTRIVYDRGKTLSFHAGPSAGEWLLDKGEKAPYQLRSVGKRFVLMDPEKELVYAFDAAGRLDFIEDRNGSRLNLTYDPAGRLLRVGDGLGRRLSFSYDGSRLTDVCDGYGRCASFGYS
ncbi:MAG TPA: DUF6531 domain-containing protein, partial [Syntrophobacteraceae bacterium]|nr:DUF6531 domain-containing protein [Syntrophobacteraceae bacterium]